MLKLNKIGSTIFILIAVSTSCTIKQHPFNFKKNIDGFFLQSVVNKNKSRPAETNYEAEAKVYKAGFVQGWKEQNNFVDWAVLSKRRQNEFTPYNRGRKSEYDCFLVLFNDKSGAQTNFLFFTVQHPWLETDVATGFSPFYYGTLESRPAGSYLLVNETFTIKTEGDQYVPTKRKKTKLYFLLDKQYGSIINASSFRIEKIILTEDNELSGNKSLAISVDEVLGDKVSLLFSYEDTIQLKP